MRVKVFNSSQENWLTEILNKFIEEIEKKNMEVVDIKFSTYWYGNNNHSFSALVMYRPVLRFDIHVSENDIPWLKEGK